MGRSQTSSITVEATSYNWYADAIYTRCVEGDAFLDRVGGIVMGDHREFKVSLQSCERVYFVVEGFDGSAYALRWRDIMVAPGDRVCLVIAGSVNQSSVSPCHRKVDQRDLSR